VRKGESERVREREREREGGKEAEREREMVAREIVYVSTKLDGFNLERAPLRVLPLLFSRLPHQAPYTCMHVYVHTVGSPYVHTRRQTGASQRSRPPTEIERYFSLRIRDVSSLAFRDAPGSPKRIPRYYRAVFIVHRIVIRCQSKRIPRSSRTSKPDASCLLSTHH